MPRPSSNGYDDDKTPVEFRKPKITMVEPERVMPVSNPSDHPRVKTARVWQSTIVSVVACVVIGVLAALQSWAVEITLMALGAATGLWAIGALRK